MYKTNAMLMQEVDDLNSKVNSLQGLINDYKYAEANYNLEKLTLKAERDLVKQQKETESWQKYQIEKTVRLLEDEVKFLRTLIEKNYGYRVSNEPSNEDAESRSL
jgi:cell fate (sporulation/competence/biofilm development) regulator YmcA (YheA/YmcA/DUF963 family)